MKQYDVVALGELLIDFTRNGTTAQGNDLFEACQAAHRVMYWPC